jgi:hypothetical protein
MPKTAVGLFENAGLVDDIVRDIEALGFPRKEVRSMEEPASFEVTKERNVSHVGNELGCSYLRIPTPRQRKR